MPKTRPGAAPNIRPVSATEPRVLLVDTSRALAELAARVAAAPAVRVAVDTEADSYHAYPEKLCLLQISLPARAGEPALDVLVDPLVGLELAPLLRALGERELILHGADFDLRLLHRTFGFVPERVFDTMIAARLLGERSFGLKALLAKWLGVEISKTARKANWGRRPLSPRLIEYAASDTRHLEALATRLGEALDAQGGRRPWHDEMTEKLVVACCREREVDPETVWRIKGSSKLKRRELAILRELWRWRDGAARKQNRPPYFVVAHEKLVALATAGASDGPAATRAMSSVQARHRRGVRAAIARGREIPDSECPERERRKAGRPMTAVQQQRLARLKQNREQAATRLGLDPTVVASKSTLERVTRDPDASEQVLHRWQRALLAPETRDRDLELDVDRDPPR